MMKIRANTAFGRLEVRRADGTSPGDIPAWVIDEPDFLRQLLRFAEAGGARYAVDHEDDDGSSWNRPFGLRLRGPRPRASRPRNWRRWRAAWNGRAGSPVVPMMPIPACRMGCSGSAWQIAKRSLRG